MRAGSQDVLTTVRKRIELVVNEIADVESIAMLRTAMSELDLALAQSDAEPVAWRVVTPSGTSKGLTEHKEMAESFMQSGYFIEPLYTAPPRPDASAGLLEAAVRDAFEEAAQIADSFGDRHEEYEPGDAIRARAATDRSRK